ncbi:MAG: Dabb family protein [bacterium]
MNYFFVLIITFSILSCDNKSITPSGKLEETSEFTDILSEIKQGPFVHSVFFWLKEPQNQNHREQFLTSLNKFISQSPNIQTRHVGSPADTDRAVIDNTYTFSLLLSFNSAEDEKAYQDEPAHKLFISESQDLWDKVLVYDSVLITE